MPWRIIAGDRSSWQFLDPVLVPPLGLVCHGDPLFPPARKATMAKIAIIGSGIAGLSAAYHLHRQHEVTIYEKAPRIGGHTRTR